MTIEHASMRAIEKPWGRTDLRPWSEAAGTHGRIGEIWYDRADFAAHKPSLLLKLLFTREPLSVQVHPGDAFAHSIGEVRGKSEAWYVMSAEPGGPHCSWARPTADVGTAARRHCRTGQSPSGSLGGMSPAAMSSMFRPAPSTPSGPGS